MNDELLNVLECLTYKGISRELFRLVLTATGQYNNFKYVTPTTGFIFLLRGIEDAESNMC